MGDGLAVNHRIIKLSMRSESYVVERCDMSTCWCAGNGIGPAGAAALAKGIAANTGLTKLSLGVWNLITNRIGDEGARAIADAVCDHPTITHLYLDSEAGVVCVCEG